MAMSASAADRFYINDFIIAPGETCTVSINLDNEAAYTAFQADLYLPDGMEADLETFALTDRKGTDHRISTKVQSDGAIRVMSYSLRVNPYSENCGAIVTFQVTASDGLTLPATIALNQVLFTCVTGNETALPDNECNVYLQGDVNCDGTVSMDDLTMLINLLLSQNDNPVYADVNRDSSVSMDDLTVLINVLLSIH